MKTQSITISPSWDRSSTNDNNLMKILGRDCDTTQDTYELNHDLISETETNA